MRNLFWILFMNLNVLHQMFDDIASQPNCQTRWPLKDTNELLRRKRRAIKTNIKSNYFDAASCRELDPL